MKKNSWLCSLLFFSVFLVYSILFSEIKEKDFKEEDCEEGGGRNSFLFFMFPYLIPLFLTFKEREKGYMSKSSKALKKV